MKSKIMVFLLALCAYSMFSFVCADQRHKGYVVFPSLYDLCLDPSRSKVVFSVTYKTGLPRPRGKITGSASGLYLMDLKTKSIRQITADSSDSFPSFSHDGSTLFFSRSNWEIPCTRIWELNLRTFKAVPLSPARPYLCEIEASLSPDGKFIAYIGVREGLFLMDIKTKKRKRLLGLPIMDLEWLPNGKILCSRYGVHQSCDVEDCSAGNYLILIDPVRGVVERKWGLGWWHMSPRVTPDGQKMLTSLGWHCFGLGYGLFVINLKDWIVEHQVLLGKTKTLGYSVEKFTSIPISQIKEELNVLGLDSVEDYDFKDWVWISEDKILCII
ncbi:MAG: hypothetical protein NZ531_03465, partial [Aquificaceae bacterium]|nr:hypothetical protein [Aquificaceae bacterium]